MRKPQSDRLMPRHVAALGRAVREAESWRGLFVEHPDPEQLAQFERFVKQAKEAMKIVRELGKQHAITRKYSK